MTEDQAKQKWCPMVRTRSAENEVAVNRGKTIVGSNCIGSACMMGCNEKGEWRGSCGLTNK